MMSRNAASYITLISELEADIGLLDDLLEKNRLISDKIEKSEPDEFDWAALGYTIHNIYNLMENYFLRVAKFFENNLTPDAWHRNLVDRMALELPGIRPALLMSKQLPAIHNLRSFRHVFRNIYQSELNSDRLKEVNATLQTTIEDFVSSHSLFIEKLQKITLRLSNRS